MAKICYDLHIHSCLSPCGDDLMSPNNILNMGMIKGLDYMAVCDHNCTLQQPVLDEVAKTIGMKILYGIEAESKEEVHVLGIFNNLKDNQDFGKYVDDHLPAIPNDENYFGKQEIKNDQDETIATYPKLLLQSLDIGIDELIRMIHQYRGKAILAHIYDKANSITHQLGFIPPSLDYDGVEVKNDEQAKRYHDEYGKDVLIFIDSDAHYLTDISEAVNEMEEKDFKEFFGLW
ncbi:MAG: PHP domain-containing protein [Erysipelotrichaceae bacterium]|nr:PHP domain-containing protein [Erysipelotrichaceae bacterium]